MYYFRVKYSNIEGGELGNEILTEILTKMKMYEKVLWKTIIVQSKEKFC